MELLFESRPNVSGMSGQLRFFQREPEVHPELVLRPETYVEGHGLTHYGTVLHDGGRLRMWYLCFSGEFPPETLGGSAAVGYAESDDGYAWRRPPLGLVQHGPTPNNLTNLGLHSATVFVDPHAEPAQRYRAVGCGRKEYHLGHPGVKDRGYFTAHSADGLDWRLDTGEPRWHSIDVVTTAWHPARREALVALKRTPTVMRIARRSIHTAAFRDGAYTDDVPALYPDDFDDLCAAQRGFHSCDYYGMAMMPAGRGMVGFLWRFYHQLPYGTGWGNGPQALYGRSDISLVYQSEPGGCWFHLPGRPLFIARERTPWPNGWFYSGSTPVTIGDEQRLYISGKRHPHGYGRNQDWTPGKESHDTFAGCGVTFAKWPKWRLFGFEAVSEATLQINLGEVTVPSRLRLNHEAIHAGGFVKARLVTAESATPLEAHPLSADSTGETLVFPAGPVIAPTRQARLQLTLDHARVYAYDLTPAG